MGENLTPLILLIWGNARERLEVFKVLCATGAAVEVRTAGESDASDLENKPCRLVVIDYDSSAQSTHEFLQSLSGLSQPPAVLVVTATRDKQDLVDLLAHDRMTNLVAKNTDLKSTELIVTVQKIMRNDVFGLEKYLTWGVEPTMCRIRSSDDKALIIERLVAYLEAIGVNRRLVGLASSVADEFVMNAVYNAPIDASGKAKYAARDRSERVDLLASEEAEFRFACDGRTLALSVADPFGQLERMTVRSYLRKCFMKGADQIDVKDGGAGLGLYYVFESLSHLVINVAPKRRTEMIGLLDVSGSFKDFAERPKSLNLFWQESAK